MFDQRMFFIILVLLFIICILGCIIYTGVKAKESNKKMLDFSDQTQCYVINLDKNKERLISFMENYDKSDISTLNIERFNAIYGKELDLEPLVSDKAYKQIKYAEENGYRLRHYELTRGAVGCFLSHMTLYKKLIEDKDKQFYIIFEDDTVIPPKIINNIQIYIQNVPNEWDILLFNTIRQVVTHQNPLYYRVKSWWGLCGYVVSKKGAEKIVKEYETQKKIDKQIDSMMSMMAVENKINVYSTRKALVTTDGSVTDIQLPVKLAKNIDPFKYEGVAL